MLTKTLIFSAGVITGATIVFRELVAERLIVNNNLDGSITMHHPHGFFRKKQ